MTYPKLNVANVTFVAEKTNFGFSTWMPLYAPNVEPYVWENAMTAEIAMEQARVERGACFLRGVGEEVSSVTTLAHSIADEVLGSYRSEDRAGERRCVVCAEDIYVKFGGAPLLKLARDFTCDEWRLIYPGLEPREGWVNANARDLVGDIQYGIVANVVKALDARDASYRKQVDERNRTA